MGVAFNPAALAEFARHYGFHYDMCDPAIIVRDVLTDMDRGLAGKSSSLAMIPAYIKPITRVPARKTVLALDAGGTNLRASLVKFDENGKALPEDTRKTAMPGTQGPVGAEAFFDKIAEAAAPLLEKSPKVEGIGFTFSYPAEITKDADGIPLSFSKEVDAPEVIGKRVGQGLREALARRKLKAPERIVLLNDTVATLLSGLAEIPADGGLGRKGGEGGQGPTGPVIGFILGTGTNVAYPEKKIPKIGFDSPGEPQIVNCETGNSPIRYLGILDREYDAATKNPGAYTLEKTTSGAYLGPLTFHVLKQAIRDGLLSFKRADEFLSWPTLQTKDLNAFMRAPFSGEEPLGKLFGPGEEDACKSFVYLTSIITQRAAVFAAAVVAAVVERTGAGFDPFAPVRIAVEGTTYMIYKGMRTALESALHSMLTAEKPRSYVISPVEQASLFGAAVAALSA
jgi:hexokinase